MPILTFPGLYFTEQGGIPLITAPATDIGAFEGLTKRGADDQLGFVTSWAQYTRLYGGLFNSSVYGDLYTPFCVKQFFENGGSACWISRTTVQSVSPLNHADLDINNSVLVPGIAMNVLALGEGEGGNVLGVSTLKKTTAINDVLGWPAAALGTFGVDDLSGFEKGDVIRVVDPSTGDTKYGYIYDIDYTTTEISAQDPLGIGWVACTDDSIITTVSTHRATSTAAVAAAAAQAVVVVADGTRFAVGMCVGLWSVTASKYEFLEVLSVVGNTITFSTNLGNAIVVGDLIISQEFDLVVYEDNQVIENHEFLSFSANSADSIATRLTGTTNESILISAATGAGADVTGAFTDGQFTPTDIAETNLTGGVDAALADADFIGTDDYSGKTGLYLFDFAGRGALNFWSIPDRSSVAVDQAAAAYSENRADTIYIAHLASTIASALEAEEYRRYTLGIDSSYVALYFPWLQIADPDNDGLTIDIPPDGAVQGAWSDSTQNNGIRKAPANDPALNNVLGLTVNLTDQEQGLLNPIGVNVIRNFAERGFRIWGARTLWGVTDGRHYINVRRIMTYVRVGLMNSAGWVVFMPNDKATRRQLYLSVRAFLGGLYRDGSLYVPDGGTVEAINGAYYVKCDGENNPPSEIELGNLHCDMGIRPVMPAEFILFNLALISGDLNVTGV